MSEFSGLVPESSRGTTSGGTNTATNSAAPTPRPEIDKAPHTSQHPPDGAAGAVQPQKGGIR